MLQTAQWLGCSSTHDCRSLMEAEAAAPRPETWVDWRYENVQMSEAAVCCKVALVAGIWQAVHMRDRTGTLASACARHSSYPLRIRITICCHPRPSACGRNLSRCNRHTRLRVQSCPPAVRHAGWAIRVRHDGGGDAYKHRRPLRSHAACPSRAVLTAARRRAALAAQRTEPNSAEAGAQARPINVRYNVTRL